MINNSLIQQTDIPLPYDVKIGPVLFRAGVSLGTLINAARRWYDRQKGFTLGDAHSQMDAINMPKPNRADSSAPTPSPAIMESASLCVSEAKAENAGTGDKIPEQRPLSGWNPDTLLQSEISVIEAAIFNAITASPPGKDSMLVSERAALSRVVFQAIRPYIRTTKPVMSKAAEDLLNERRRQVSQEGWTQEHDEQHLPGELALAAACYAAWDFPTVGVDIQHFWPWSDSWWKPKDRRSNLIRAGALILAEIERLDRKGVRV